MSLKRMIGIALIAAGILGLVYRGFSYTKDTHQAKIGPLELNFKEKEHVTVPIWAGVVAIVVGAALVGTKS